MAVRKHVNDASRDPLLIWLVHQGAGESKRESALSALGYRVVSGPWNSKEITRKKAELPAVVIIDLSASPPTGRDTAVAMRSHSALVNVPFILVEGKQDSVLTIRKFLPDALSTTWPRIHTALVATRTSPATGGRKLSVFAAYEGKFLADKLGIKAGATVAAVNAPPGFRATLGTLPNGAKIQPRPPLRDLTLWFVRSIEELRDGIAEMKAHAAFGRLWIIWRKGASGESALSQTVVRKTGLDCGLVDFRISRIDEEWAGLRFTIRK